MIDHIFSALLTFCLLAGGTVAIGSAMADYDHQVAAQRSSTKQQQQPQEIVQLPAVEVIYKRPKVAQTDVAEPTARTLQ
jgi:hypothetical protein